jgi:hypothetical protein
MDGVRRRNVVACRQRLVVPAIAEGDGEQGVLGSNDVLPRGHGRTLGGCIVTIDNADIAGFVTGATDQQGAHDKASHQALKARCTHTLRYDCETHPPLPLWWLKM